MSLQTRLSSLITAIATDIKALRANTSHPAETGTVKWTRSSDGALVAELVAATSEGANKLATLTQRTSASGTSKSEIVLEAKNGTPVSRIRVKNDPLATPKRKISLEVSDESGTVIQTRDLLRSDGTSDLREKYTTHIAPTQLGFGSGWTNYSDTTYLGGQCGQTEDGIGFVQGLVTSNGSGYFIADLDNHGVTPPPKKMIFLCLGSGGVQRVDVWPDGVIAQGGGAASAVSWLSLNNIRWHLA